MKTIKSTFTLSVILFSQLSLAGFELLSKQEIRALIGDFPTRGSQAEFDDDEVLLNYQQTRTKDDCDFADSQSSFNPENIFTKPVGPLSEDEFEDVRFKVYKLAGKVGLNVMRAKDMFDRPRPYERNPEINPCIDLESSSAYPSGHTAIGHAIGIFLANRFPEHAVEIMKVADQVGTNRIIGGVHHPSDIVAGRKIGEKVAMRVLLFQED